MKTRWLIPGIITLAFLGAGCRRDNKESGQKEPTPESLDLKRRTYCELIRPRYDSQHFVNAECDSAGFTSLFSLACGDLYPVDLSVFSGPDGRLHRSPDHKKCWDYDLSDEENAALGRAAGFSKDHMLMRMVGAWVQKDLAWVEGYLAFGEEHNWEICRARDTATYLSRCLASPSLVALLRQMRDRLKGTAAARLAAGEGDALPADFEAHLRVWRTWLRGKAYGGITDGEKEELAELAAREPANALYQAVNQLYHGGVTGSAYELLGASSHWPEGKLPNNQEHHCTDYLYQRDMLKAGVANPDWLPCPGEDFVEHPTTEYGAALFVAHGGG